MFHNSSFLLFSLSLTSLEATALPPSPLSLLIFILFNFSSWHTLQFWATAKPCFREILIYWAGEGFGSYCRRSTDSKKKTFSSWKAELRIMDWGLKRKNMAQKRDFFDNFCCPQMDLSASYHLKFWSRWSPVQTVCVCIYMYIYVYTLLHSYISMHIY